jgi:phosphoribosylaminoimidazole (AIR) synthetase
LPEGLGLEVQARWARAPIFDLLARSVEEREMRRTFNAGVGFVIVVAKAEAGRALDVLRGLGERPFELGRVLRVAKDTAFEARLAWS